MQRPAALPQDLTELFRSIGIDRDYSPLDPGELDLDLQGWGSNHPIFEEVFRELRPQLVIEVGTWKGASLLRMHALSRELGCGTKFVCVDTWLGSADHWLSDQDRSHLQLRGGYPTIFRQFAANLIAKGATGDVFPLPMTSLAAARVLWRLNVVADAVYIDGGHDYEEVAADLRHYSSRLRDGGIMFGDDYHSRWPGVVRAVDEFCTKRTLELRGSKWLVRDR